MRDYNQGARKAAILLASLDPASAESLLGEMSPSQALAARQAARCLGEIDPEEQRQVIDEFFRIGPLVPNKQPSGIELGSRLPPDLIAPSSSEPAARSKALLEAPLAVLAGFLNREHPQTIAVVVSNLPPARAAEVLATLPPEQQVDVARRLVELDETDPEILGEVERGLETWLEEQSRVEGRRVAGIASLHDILNAATPQARQHLLANLSRHDRNLAGKLNAPPRQPPAPVKRLEHPVTFADLEKLDSALLAAVLRRAEPEIVALALAGARSEFAERCCSLFAPPQSQSLRRALCELGPTRLSDVEAAQQELAEVARRMAAKVNSAAQEPNRLSVAV